MGDVVQAAELSLITDWQFWAAIVAALALVLSQLPPVKLWFKSKNLDVEVHSRLLVTHKVGNPNVSLFVSLRNTGGRQLWVRALRLSVLRDGQHVATLPAQNYFETPSSQTSILFIPFSLKVGDTWSHATNFLNYFDRNTEKTFRAAETALRTDIEGKLRARPEEDKNLVEADPALVVPFMAIFDRLFVWQAGEYVVELSIDTDYGERAFAKRYRFTLFESDATELRSHTADFKFGGGLSYNVERHIGVFVPITAHDG